MLSLDLENDLGQFSTHRVVSETPFLLTVSCFGRYFLALVSFLALKTVGG